MKFNEILEKLKDILSKEKGERKVLDKDIATALDIEYVKFRKQKSRNIIPYLEIMTFLAKRNISINWFFFSQLPESLIEETSNYILVKYQRSITASAGGGGINDTDNLVNLILDKKLLDYINSSYKYTEILKISGESMEPTIKDDSLIFIDRSKRMISGSNTYAINTLDGLVVKRIKVVEGKYYLESNNDLYISTKIDVFDIIGEVRGVLTKI